MRGASGGRGRQSRTTAPFIAGNAPVQRRRVSAVRCNRLLGRSLDGTSKRAVPTDHGWSSISPGRQVLLNQGSNGP